MKTPYQILGIPENASLDEVKKAYKTWAKQLHPDVNPSSEAATQFIRIQQAYEQIIHPKKTTRALRKRPQKPNNYRPRPKSTTQETDEKGSGFFIFMLIILNLVLFVLLIPRTFITWYEYFLAFFIQIGLLLFWFVKIKAKHYTYGLFFGVLYSFSMMHGYLLLNYLISKPLPSEIYSYERSFEERQTSYGKMVEYDHILHLENNRYYHYPAIRMVFKQTQEFYTHSTVEFKVSQGAFGFKILDEVRYVR